MEIFHHFTHVPPKVRIMYSLLLKMAQNALNFTGPRLVSTEPGWIKVPNSAARLISIKKAGMVFSFTLLLLDFQLTKRLLLLRYFQREQQEEAAVHGPEFYL